MVMQGYILPCKKHTIAVQGHGVQNLQLTFQWFKRKMVLELYLKLCHMIITLRVKSIKSHDISNLKSGLLTDFPGLFMSAKSKLQTHKFLSCLLSILTSQPLHLGALYSHHMGHTRLPDRAELILMSEICSLILWTLVLRTGMVCSLLSFGTLPVPFSRS